MKPLFQTTVKRLINSTKQNIEKLEDLVNKQEKEVLDSIYNGNIHSIHTIKLLLNSVNYNLINKLKTYKENLEYLESCNKELIVDLDQTEWRHYFLGDQRPEWC